VSLVLRYKPAWPLADALAELIAERGRRFDPRSSMRSSSWSGR
jgi:response regulator RpfG family c-di-GMP phosphodiesterase